MSELTGLNGVFDQNHRNNSKVCHKRKRRSDPAYRDNERESDAEAKRAKRQRLHPKSDVKQDPKEKQPKPTRQPLCPYQKPTKTQIANLNSARLLAKYFADIKDDLSRICGCCGGLWYKRSMTKLNQAFLSDSPIRDKILGVDGALRPDGSCEFCSNCAENIRAHKVPKMALMNGFKFPEIHPSLTRLTNLEERLVALRLPFMQIKKLGRDRQFGLVRNVVNVPNDLEICVNSLPRTDAATVEVMLMRKQSYDKPYIHENVRPDIVFAAAKHLLRTPIYRAENVQLCVDWMNQISQFSHYNPQPENSDPDEDSDCESDDDRVNPTELETMMVDSYEHLRNLALRIAPGEGKSPKSLLADVDCDIKTFPKIYGGLPRKFEAGVKVSYADIAKSESRMYDRRAAGPTKLLYTCKKLQIYHVSHAVSVCMRKKISPNYTAGELCEPRSIDTIIDHDEGYKCLSEVRGSPPYLEEQQKRVMAMLRQLGMPAFFITFSAAETKWPELLVLLKKVLKGVVITEAEAADMSFEEKAELIREDPITCARNFENRYGSMLKHLLTKPGGVFCPYKVSDYYQRVEFQKRGSPHSHGLYWVDGSPIYEPGKQESISECTAFIDKFVTCKRIVNEKDELYPQMQYQIHKHNRACLKKAKGKKSCRFHYPLPPMQNTTILTPLPRNIDSDFLRTVKQDSEKLQQTLAGIDRSFTEDVPFTAFLDTLGLTSERYENAVRYRIKRTTVLLKRDVNAIYVNSYNPQILLAWNANMDIQFILDPYACAKYCANYINKSCGEVSKVLRELRNEIRGGNDTLAANVRKFGNAFLNKSEICAQEAAYLVLGMPLTLSSRETVYINTGPPNERVFFLKPRSELLKLPEDSNEIGRHGLIEHYIRRRSEQEQTCLAEFAACYSNYKSLAKRKFPRIIRYRRYNKEVDPDLYMREQIMLYVPWRNESWLDEDISQKFEQHFDTIQQSRATFVHPSVADDFHPDDNERQDTDDEDNDPSPHGLRIEDVTVDQFPEKQQTGTPKRQNVEYITPPTQIPEETYVKMVHQLNEKQWKYFLHLIHLLKLGETPFYDFISGGAGVGKSHLITVVVQAIIRIFSKSIDVLPNDVFILVCASTGKAAYNIRGVTLHCAFRLAIKFNTAHRLSDSACNTLRIKLAKLKLIVIDEISMVTLKSLYQLDSRLRQIFSTDEPFGNIPIMVVGDFRQIRPVKGQFVFELPKDDIIGQLLQNHLWKLFRMFELTEVMRQQGDIPFIIALNRMGDGTMTQDDVDLIRSRIVTDDVTLPADAVHLFNTNNECEEYNEQAQSLLQTEFARVEAIDKADGAIRNDTQILQDIKEMNHTKTDGLPSYLHLKLGALYMVSQNIDVADGIFNGACGILKHIEYGLVNGKNMPIRVYLKFEDDSTGASARRTWGHHQVKKNIDTSLTPIQVTIKPLTNHSNEGGRITRIQFPIIPANGITICKAQGSSFHNVVLHLKHRLRRDLLYVGCSRCYSIEGLYLVGEFNPPEKLSPYIAAELDRLRQDPLKLSLKFLCDTPNNCAKLIFHNVQSLRRHRDHIANEISFKAADVMTFVEPKTVARETYEFHDFNCALRADADHPRSSKGSIIFVKAGTTYANAKYCSYESATGHIETSEIKIRGVTALTVYRSPTSKPKHLRRVLKTFLRSHPDVPVLIVGDINIDMSHPSNDVAKLNNLLAHYDIRNMLDTATATTDNGTSIDICFTNITTAEAWVYESLFSYHKPICVTWM